MPQLSVLTIGSNVEVGPEHDPISATIRQVSLIGRGPSVEYEVVYWSEAERVSLRVDSTEVRPVGSCKRLKIGFVAPEESGC